MAKIILNKQEREALEWLQNFTTNLLDGEAVIWTRPTIAHLQKMGININFVIHKNVEKLKKGKEEPFYLLITNAPNYMKGLHSTQYLPFQIKALKAKKG